MKADLPNSAIQVSAMNDNVVLAGSVSSALESTRAADLAASFTGDPKKVVNMLRVAGGEQVMLKVRISEMQRQIAKQFGINLSGNAVLGTTPIALATDNPFGLLGQALDDLFFYCHFLASVSYCCSPSTWTARSRPATSTNSPEGSPLRHAGPDQPARSEMLMTQAQHDITARYQFYEQLAGVSRAVEENGGKASGAGKAQCAKEVAS